MTACDYLILGGGRAGLCAAEAIRKNDKTGSITMISDEAQLPYSRPMLTKLPLAFYEVEKTLVQPSCRKIRQSAAASRLFPALDMVPCSMIFSAMTYPPSRAGSHLPALHFLLSAARRCGTSRG